MKLSAIGGQLSAKPFRRRMPTLKSRPPAVTQKLSAERRRLLLLLLFLRAAELAQGLLGLLAEAALRVVLDEAREVRARVLAQVFGRELRLLARLGFGERLLALALRKVEAAHAGDVEHLVEFREFGVAGDQLVGALVRGEVCLLVVEVVARDLKLVLRALLRVGFARHRRAGGHRAALPTRAGKRAGEGQRNAANRQ